MRKEKRRMRNRVSRFAVVIVSSVVCLFTGGRADADGDFVYRPELALSGPVWDTLRWTASLEPQIASNVQQSAEIALIGGFCWRPVSYLAVGPQLMYVTKGSNPDSTELRPRLDLEICGPGVLRKIAFRNRFEYRMKEDKDEYWRYRARVKAKLPECGQFTPFLYDEVFYEFGDKNELNGNEGGVGVAIALADRVKLTVDFRLCYSRSEDSWGTGNRQLLTTFEYSF
jgi:hypothetical protein